MNTIWINTTEVSGDLHTSFLVKALKKALPEYSYIGMGGILSQEAGMNCIYSINELSVMGVLEVCTALPRALKLIHSIKQDLLQYAPKAIILIDSPSFNLHIAKIAYKLAIPVYYYICPKIWASRPKRSKIIKKYIKKSFCIFPFEAEFFKKHSLPSEYVGNPLQDYIDNNQYTSISKNKNAITLLPGSRKSEIRSLLPIFIDSIKKLLKDMPYLEITCILAPSIEKEFVLPFFSEIDNISLLITKDIHTRYKQIAQSRLVLAASGTATLECALLGSANIIIYKVHPFSAWLMKQFILIRYVGLPNIIMNKEIFPELLQENATSATIYAMAKKIVTQEEIENTMYKEIQKLKETLYVNHNVAEYVACSIKKDFSLPIA
ncbi:MAG: lipid-A-disaccharide synthase [Desulfovibrionaceae bacterium]